MKQKFYFTLFTIHFEINKFLCIFTSLGILDFVPILLQRTRFVNRKKKLKPKIKLLKPSDLRKKVLQMIISIG